MPAQSHGLRRLLALTLALSFVASSCRTGPTKRPSTPATPAPTTPAGLALRLSDATPRTASPRTPPAVEPLPELAARQLLDRVAPPPPPVATMPLGLGPRTPPPQTGATTAAALRARPRSSPPTALDVTAPLTITRVGPQGDLREARTVQIAFSQPMVPITSRDLTASTVPATLTPSPPGRWRWLDTQTLVFDPVTRLPQATAYTIEVAAGARSLTGATLDRPRRVTFTTAAPQIETTWPGAGPQPLDVPMFIRFDQRIDPAAVLSRIAITAAGETYAARLVARRELDRHPELKALVEASEAADQGDRWLAFATTRPLPRDTHVVVTVGVGTPSLEGPRTTSDAQRFAFDTYPPLRIVSSSCVWDDCYPGTPYEIRFNNPIDPTRLAPAHITTIPAITDRRVELDDRTLTILGSTAAQTTYQIGLAAGVVDRFGQSLDDRARVAWAVGGGGTYFFPPSEVVVLDPRRPNPRLAVDATGYTGIRLRLYQVTPADFPAFRAARSDASRPVPGTMRADTVVPVAGSRIASHATELDLTAALTHGHGRGHVIAVIEPTPTPPGEPPARALTWVQATDLAIDAIVDAQRLHAWVTRLADGASLDGVTLSTTPPGTTATTRADGTAMLAMPLAAPADTIVLATRGDDVAFLPIGEDAASIDWPRRRDGGLRWYVVDDRQLYRPGEEVRVKGWLRQLAPGAGGDLAKVPAEVTAIGYRVGVSGRVIASGTAPLSALGGFDLAFTIPADVVLGGGELQLETIGGLPSTAYHAFMIEEFRRPEYEVQVSADDTRAVLGEHAELTVAARYFTGAALPDAAVDWNVTATGARFTPPGRDEFTFGDAGWYWDDPWWAGDVEPRWHHAGTTDAGGLHVLRVDLESMRPVRPLVLTARASVADLNRQAWSASTEVLVHPAAHYLGLRPRHRHVARGEAIEIDAIDVDLDGRAVIGKPIALTAVRLSSWAQRDGHADVPLDPQTCALTSTTDAGRCTFATPSAGRYRITGVVTDDAGRRNESALEVWVSGDDAGPAGPNDATSVEVIADAADYQPGDTARLMVVAPFWPAEGLLSVRRGGLISATRFTMTGPTHALAVAIGEDAVPKLEIQVDLIRMPRTVAASGHAPPPVPRIARATGELYLHVPPRRRTLSVTINPSTPVATPGARTQLAVEVRDAGGVPVPGAEVAVIAVDEAILALADYDHADPIAAFYGDRDDGVRRHDLRDLIGWPSDDEAGYRRNVSLGFGATLGTAAGADGEDGVAYSGSRNGGRSFAEVLDSLNRGVGVAFSGAGAQYGGIQFLNALPGAPIDARTDLRPLAVFEPAVRTGADGTATVAVTLPDSLTRYRLVALAASGATQFGKGEGTLTTRLPVMVRPSPPRFLNLGDRFELPLLVENQSDRALAVDVAVRADSATVTAGAGQRVTVAAHDRVELRFPATATRPGAARFEIVASTAAGDDAVEVVIPVHLPAATEHVATYGHLDAGAIAQPVVAPAQLVDGFGGLEIETFTSQAQTLTAARDYFVTYPYDCSEQLASRVIAIAALRDLAAPARGSTEQASLERRLSDDLLRLWRRQHDDGGFSFWDRDDASLPFLTVHVVNALVRARAQGVEFPPPLLEEGLAFLAAIDDHLPGHDLDQVRQTIVAYALYTRALAGDRDLTSARRLMADSGGADRLAPEAAAWLLGVVAASPAAASERAALLRAILALVDETAATAHVAAPAPAHGHLVLHSDHRIDAIVLEALIAEAPTHALIPKLAAGLRERARDGRWESTQDSALAVAALARYARAYEQATPDVVATVWFGDRVAGDHRFAGRGADAFRVAVPMDAVAAAGARDARVTIQRRGAGRLYYRIGMTYAPSTAVVAADDAGFTVIRTYEGVDAADDVVRQADGAWVIRAGARVRVRVSMVADAERHHVALVDALPAGLEPTNPALATTGPAAAGSAPPRSRPWYTHDNLRDDRVEVFTDEVAAGVYAYSYLARATTPGTFTAAPARAEEMYHPETSGRSASDAVVIR